MDDDWIRKHVRRCVGRHGVIEVSIVAKMEELSNQETDADNFVGEIGGLIEASSNPKVSQARKCVQDAIVFTIVDTEGTEPDVPYLYQPLACAAIAKYLWGAYKRL